MKCLKVEKALLKEFENLLEIPITRQYLEHARGVCKIHFADHIKEHMESKKSGKIKSGAFSTATAETNQNDPVLPHTAAVVFDFHLNYKEGKWKPFIELINTPFDLQDLMPAELIELITAHSYAQYKWYYIKDLEFQTKNFGLREFCVDFKYINPEFISGKVEIIMDRNFKTVTGPQGNDDIDDNIIHLNRNRRQFLDMLDDSESCEFLHYLFTFPFLRSAILTEFRKKIKLFLSEKFESNINQSRIKD